MPLCCHCVFAAFITPAIKYINTFCVSSAGGGGPLEAGRRWKKTGCKIAWFLPLAPSKGGHSKRRNICLFNCRRNRTLTADLIAFLFFRRQVKKISLFCWHESKLAFRIQDGLFSRRAFHSRDHQSNSDIMANLFWTNHSENSKYQNTFIFRGPWHAI